MFADLSMIHDLAPYFGLSGSPCPPLPMGKSRNVLFLGWGGNFGDRILKDCDYVPTELEILWFVPIARECLKMQIFKNPRTPKTGWDQSYQQG